MSDIATTVARPFGPGRRGATLASVLVAAAVGCFRAVPTGVAAARVPASQPLVVLLHDHVARTRPTAHAGRTEAVAARRPLTGARTVLPILGHAVSRTGAAWLRVRLPGRPNGHRGWISANRTRRSSTQWHLVVERSARRVIVYRGGRVRRQFRAVVGKPSTPTPRGAFFIEEAVALSSYEPGGPFALATSARSNVFQEFEGGPGQIGIHGTNNLTGAPGTAVSHGCIRLDTHAITWLARRIGAGVPLTIGR
ncbi:MAG: L,D-transpeptidase [Solirubrobacterales bacterium]|nr:L,D-transpeptidase [Solirubrobacterales bacterium]